MNVWHVLTGGALHNIAEIFCTVVDVTTDLALVPYQHRLAANRNHVLVFHATEFAGGEAGAVHDQISSFAGMVGVDGVGDVREDLSLEHNACFETLADAPRKIDGRVDTDRCENVSAVDTRR